MSKTAAAHADETLEDVRSSLTGVQRCLRDGTPLTALFQTVEALEVLQVALGEVVNAARERGETWQRIGDALGISRQAAHERFSSTSI